MYWGGGISCCNLGSWAAACDGKGITELQWHSFFSTPLCYPGLKWPGNQSLLSGRRDFLRVSWTRAFSTSSLCQGDIKLVLPVMLCHCGAEQKLAYRVCLTQHCLGWVGRRLSANSLVLNTEGKIFGLTAFIYHSNPKLTRVLRKSRCFYRTGNRNWVPGCHAGVCLAQFTIHWALFVSFSHLWCPKHMNPPH